MNITNNILSIIKRWVRIHYRIVLPITVLLTCFLVFLCNVIKIPRVKQTKSTIPVFAMRQLKQFNHINAELTNLKNKLDAANHNGNRNIVTINTELNQVQKQLLKLNIGKDIQQMSHEISLSHDDLSVKIANLQKLTDSIKKQIMPVKYLKASVLPFKVVSVDIWNGMPYVTIMVDGKSKLIDKNETINHWVLVNLDYATQQVIFRKNRQYVKERISA